MAPEYWVVTAVALVGYLLANLLEKILVEIKNLRLAVDRMQEDERVRVGVDSIETELRSLAKHVYNREW